MNALSTNVLLVDGMALLFRSYYATAVTGHWMRNSNGIATNGVQGFLKHLFAAIAEIQPSHIAICWDMGSKTFRDELFSDYKANREAPPDELVPQFDMVKEVATALRFINIGVSGYEADDCIGTMTKQLSHRISIVTGDQDLLQLLANDVNVYLLQKGIGNYKKYTESQFVEEKGIHPSQWVEVKALMGDASDGYPGVKGIGEKTALKLIKTYGTVEKLLEQVHELTPAQQKKITEHKEMLRLSRTLAEIYCDVPLAINFAQMKWNFNLEVDIETLHQFELRYVIRYLTNESRMQLLA